MAQVPKTPQEYQDLLGHTSLEVDSIKERSRTAANMDESNFAEEVVAPVRTAMSLIASGKVGSELDGELREAHSLGDIQAAAPGIRMVRAKFEGVIGRFVHDPSWFDSCRDASRALKANKQAEPDMVLRRMAKCASCSLRTGNKCTLMGKPLVSALPPVASKMVAVRLRNLVAKKQITSERAQSLGQADPILVMKTISGNRLVNASREDVLQSPFQRIASTKNLLDEHTQSKKRVASSYAEMPEYTSLETPKTVKNRTAAAIRGKSKPEVDWQNSVLAGLTKLSPTSSKWSSKKAQAWVQGKIRSFQAKRLNSATKAEKQLYRALERLVHG